MKGVFEISGASRYDDLIAERYHFPRIYLRAVETCVGDWIVYRETGSAGGRKAYVAARWCTVSSPIRPMARSSMLDHRLYRV